jgi:hypothetical protein
LTNQSLPVKFLFIGQPEGSLCLPVKFQQLQTL